MKTWTLVCPKVIDDSAEEHRGVVARTCMEITLTVQAETEEEAREKAWKFSRYNPFSPVDYARFSSMWADPLQTTCVEKREIDPGKQREIFNEGAAERIFAKGGVGEHDPLVVVAPGYFDLPNGDQTAIEPYVFSIAEYATYLKQKKDGTAKFLHFTQTARNYAVFRSGRISSDGATDGMIELMLESPDSAFSIRSVKKDNGNGTKPVAVVGSCHVIEFKDDDELAESDFDAVYIHVVERKYQ